MPNYLKNADELQNELLSEISDKYEKTKGYFIWDILKAISICIKNLLINLQSVSDSLDVSNLNGEKLDTFIYDRAGLKRKEATFAKGVIHVIGNGTINVGDIFETEGLIKFESEETKKIIGNGDIKIKAVKSGVIGNVGANTITKMPVTIAGITECNNISALADGYEAETDIDFRNRYYEHLQMPATSGNIYHYLIWAKEVTGVGDAKCFPLWNGDNTVKIVIINSERQPASSKLVNEVQNYIDPGISGKGEGEAPIGAFCTVESAVAKNLNVKVNIRLIEGNTVESVKLSIAEKLNEHLKEIAFKQNYVSYAHVGAVILNADGVLDYNELLIGNRELLKSNMECSDEEVIILGDVILSII